MEDKIKWYHKLALETLWIFSRSICIMPRLIRYHFLKPIIGCILYLLRYRRSIITDNLAISFPEKSKEEIKHLVWSNYMFLAEVAIDTISLAGANDAYKDLAVNWVNADEMHHALDGKDWIAMSAHYGCWEYLPLWGRQQEGHIFMSVYHPMKSVVFELFYQRIRAMSDNIVQVPMKQTVRYYLLNRGGKKNHVIGLLSDQSPILRADSHWFTFFNRPTVFNDGAEALALKFKLPVYFAHSQRVAPGRYIVRCDEIYDGNEQVAPHEITQRYIMRLEEMIRESPELWTWSHHRWRHTPDKQLERFGKSTLPATHSETNNSASLH